MHEGTFIVKPQDPKTGYSPDVPGQGSVDVRRPGAVDRHQCTDSAPERGHPHVRQRRRHRHAHRRLHQRRGHEPAGPRGAALEGLPPVALIRPSTVDITAGMGLDRQVTQPSSRSYSLMSTTTGGIRAPRQLGGPRRRGRDQHVGPAERDHVGAGLLRNRRDARERVGSIRSPHASRVPSGSAVTADLRCSTLRQRHRDHGATERRQQRGRAGDPVGVGAPAPPDVDGRPICSTSPPSSVPGAAMRATEAEAAHRLGDRGGLGPALGRARAGDDGQSVDDDDGVLDEHGVGAVVGGRHGDDVPTGAASARRVRRVLAPGQRRGRPASVRCG